MKRREFLKAAGGGALLAATAGTAEARPNKTPPPDAVGMLYDSTICIGCRACMVSCKEINGMPQDTALEEKAWDAPTDLSGKTLNIIKAYKDGSGAVKDREQDGFAFVKRHCQHCVDAGCVSVCPVKAMRKDEKTGVVTHHADKCIGCRYCVYACPYNVPKWEFDKAFGQIQKCQFCNQAGVERLDKGLLPGCVEVCPTGASLFGSYKDILAEAKRRLALKPGEVTLYPRGRLGDDRYPPHEAAAAAYQPHAFGEKEGGGTQVVHLAAVPFEKLGLPTLPERSYAAKSESVQGGIYWYGATPLVALFGLAMAVKKNMGPDKAE